MTDRNFYLERLAERLRELRQLHRDDTVFFIEASKVMRDLARNDRERMEADELLKLMKTCRRFGIFEK